MSVSLERALAECIQHYVDRGNSLEEATTYMTRSEEEVFRVYEIIQKEKEIGEITKPINLADFTKRIRENDE